MIFVGIITSIVIFSIIVLIHEYGHFKTARIFGVRVEEFGLGIPPRAKKLFTDKKGTLFSLNWLPLGGFVKLTGEQAHGFLLYNKKNKRYNNETLLLDIQKRKDIFDKKGNQVDPETLKEVKEMLLENKADYNLSQKPAWQQSVIMLAGVTMNFLLAIFIFSILFFVGVKPIGINTQLQTERKILLIPTPEQAIEIGIISKSPGVRINPVEGSIARASGLLGDDVITQVNDEKIETPEQLMNIIGSNANNILTLHVDRFSGEKLELPITPGADGKIGAYLGENIEVNKDFEYKFGILKSIKYGTLETYNQTMLTFKALGGLVRKIIRPRTTTERSEAIEQVSGPIGIVDFISGAMSNGIVFLIIIGAIISINLAVFNLLPIPALDGGRFIFIVLNTIVLKITGKKAIGERLEGIIHVGFFVFLILLSILIAYNDILKIGAN